MLNYFYFFFSLLSLVLCFHILHIRRAKIIAFDQKPGQKESEYIQAFHAQIVDADFHLAFAEEIFVQLCISRLHNQHGHGTDISPTNSKL